MKIFDIHTHIFPDKVASRAVSHLREKSHGIPAWLNGTAMDLERAALKAGYSGWMNCPVVTNLKQMQQVNDWSAAMNRWPHLSFGGLFLQAEPTVIINEVLRIKSLGLCGIKLHPEYQGFSPLESRLAPVWAAIAEVGLPVLFHAGSDIGFYGAGRHSRPGDFAELAARHPTLKIICAHMGGWRNWNEVETELCGAPVYFDTSFSKAWMGDREQFERIIRKHGVERILYGTDSPWNELTDGIAEIRETSLSDREKEMIFWDNAAALLHLEEPS